MIRPVLTELALFVAPFVIFELYLIVTAGGIFKNPARWTWPIIGWLSVAGLMLVIVSFVVLAHFSGVAPGSAYTPAHMENGKLVPGSNE